MKKVIYTIALCCSFTLLAQEKENIPSQGDTFTYKRLDILETEKDDSKNSDSYLRNESPQLARSSSSSGIGETPGFLSVSLTGAATYEVPIATPPGVRGIAPEISLRYNSQASVGIAGYGWNIGGLSVISRIPSTKYHDSNIDGVDFDSSDRFSLDGQRLVLKSGTYGANGAVYETENYSNLKIISYGTSPYGASYGPSYFIVYYPDGSKAYYGFNSGSKSRTTYAISYWQDHKGVKIDYEYLQSYNSLFISKIKYGTTSGSSTAPINEIRFTYKDISSSGYGSYQQAYINNISFIKDKLLTQIESYSNNIRFRRYTLSHTNLSGYARLNHIQEHSSDLSQKHTWISFQYDTSSDVISYQGLTTTGLNNVEQRNAKTASLDLTGNGKMDYLVYPNAKNKFWLFKDVQNGSYNYPYEVNTGAFKSLFPVTWLNHQGKILEGQGIGVVQEGTNNTVNFKVYSNGTTSPIYYQYTKTWNQPTYSYYLSPNNSTEKRIPFEYVSGDFNGDGLTEVLAIGMPYTSRYCNYHGDCNDPDPCDVTQGPIDCLEQFQKKSGQMRENQNVDKNFLSVGKNASVDNTLEVTAPFDVETTLIGDCNYSCYSSTSNYKSVYKIDLKRDVSSGYVKYSGYLQEHLTGNYKLLTGDFNGDGRTDVMHITEGKKVYVYTFDNSGNMQLLWTTNLYSTYNPDPNWPFLLGDYNGDGKTDFMHPTAKNSKNFVMGLSTGTGFQMGTRTMDFTFHTSTWSGSELNTYNYISIDANGDGKTDVVMHRAKTYNDSSNGTQYIYMYKNEGLRSLSNVLDIRFTQRSSRSTTGNLKHYPIPIFLSSDQENKNLEIAAISHNWIKKFSFNSDLREDALIKEISNNGVTYEIEYKNLDPTIYNQDGIQIYHSGYDQIYPNVDVRIAPDIKVVTMFKRVCTGTPTLKQLFAYQGGVYNVEGLSFLGFQGFVESNWHTGYSDRIFNTSKYDVNLRGAMVAEYSQPNNFNFSIPSSNYILKTTYQHGHSLSGTKVFKSWVNSKLVQNALQGVNINTSYQYDSYNSPTNIVTDYYNHGSTNVTYTYANSTGSTYYIGRATKRVETTTVGGNSFSTEQQFVYSGYQLTQIKSKGNGTSFNTVSFEYDHPFGNVKKQTTTPSGESSRIVQYEYDDSGRFLKKHTDIEGLVTNYQYNADTGTLTSMTNAYGQTTSYEYDIWNRQIKETDYLGKALTTSYEEYSNQYTVTSNGDDGSGMISKFDRLQRLSEVHEKDILGQWIKTKYEYDKFDRVSRVSEPYTGSSPTQWNETLYDFYGRPKEQTLHTGRTFNISYSGLTTTVNDGVKTVSSTVDAMGNTKKVTDPGGTINYTYHGNGSLKTASFNGVLVSTEIDGWGRKTKLIDPSAGTYEYEYNGFGELTKEITPKGTTNYDYSPVGKLQQKIIQGDNTDMTISYTYHPTHKSPTNISMTSADGNNSSYAYTYDTQVRLTSVTENNPYAQFKKSYTYDAFGRVSTEDYYAKLLSNSRTSQKKIVNIYQNGGLKQINNYDNNAVLWQVNSLNARGQITDASYGQIKSLNAFDPFGYLTSIKANKASDNANLMTLTYDFDVQRGTLNSRTNSMFSWSETFGYDNLDRLVSFNDNDGNKNHTYDAFGRITENSAVGGYSYFGSTSYQLSEIDLNIQGDLYYQNNSLQQISFNAFKSPHEIKEDGKDRIGFQYNAFMGRSHRFYGGFEDNLLQRNNRKHYAFDGSMEISHDIATDKTTFVSFIGGNAYDAPAIWRSEQGPSSSNKFYFLHRDHMNSILMITEENGVIAEKRHFDAWGNIVKLTDGNGNDLEDFKIIDRGYTSHEHLSSVGLIHMNGRLYDPNLRRFLSPDNYIQDITSSQNFNRYGYVLNNPLMYWDPSGEQTETGSINSNFIIGTAIALGSFIANSWENIKSWDWKGLGDAIARPYREVGRFFKKLFGGGKKHNSVKEVSNPQNLTMDPLARSSLEYAPTATTGIGQADTGLRILKTYVEFNIGFKRGFIAGAKSTWSFIKSLRTAQGWKNLGQGFVNFAQMGTMYSPEGMLMRVEMGMAINDYVTNIPNMSVYEVSYDLGYIFEQAVETFFVSKGAGMAVNAVKGTATAIRGSTAAVKGVSNIAKTPVGRSGNVMKILTKNSPATIGGRKFTGHALDQMQSRGIISPRTVLDVINNPARTFPGNTPGTSVFIRDNLKIITNKAGDIITVIPQ
ncbi:FG-GAP-like repeat-containing protein [Zhouia spongiae]|uniref:FG-GAP-like repeat-containing protein n=1 Tax=Zhouia spongiae TaxID=2202721 RepID=A0ABY3YQB4_9FLAO|nr:FG-GAP-like repeat-containing protein [Zhouia spongiae]UNY99767.1 FG-GAP-like repeat-containing protein [Zhouia spongiae]